MKKNLIRLVLPMALVLAAMLPPAASAAEYCFSDLGIVHIDYYQNGELVGACHRNSLMCGDLSCWGEVTNDEVPQYGNCWTCYILID